MEKIQRPSVNLEARCDQALSKITSDVMVMDVSMSEYSQQRSSLQEIARLTEERSMECHACGDEIALEKRYCDGCGARRPLSKRMQDELAASNEFCTSIWNL